MVNVTPALILIDLLPRGLLGRQRIKRLAERVRNDCAHGLVPRPIRVDIRLPKQTKEPLPTILHRCESIVVYDEIVGEFGSGWEGRDR